MNVGNRIQAATEELSRAAACLDEARMLRANSYPYGAVSRAYYGAFHAARALLFSLGLEAKSHRAVVNMVGEHFVKTGRLTPDLGRLVSRLQRDREDADYQTGAVFTDEEAATTIDDAERFVAAARALLS